MLFKLTEHIRRTRPLAIPHPAVVKDVADPNQQGRIKVDSQGLFDDIPLERRPWIYPWHPPELGSTDGNISTFMVPRLESEVVITFPYDDIYFGFYVARWDTKGTKPFASFDGTYPEVYGFSDSDGNRFKVDMETHITEFRHKSGTVVRIAANGDVNVESVRNVNLISGGKGVVTGDCYDPSIRRNHQDFSSRVTAKKS